MRGRVKFFNTKRGFGFVRGENEKDSFIHFSNINMDGSRILQTNDLVEYEEVRDVKGQKAINLKLINEVTPNGLTQEISNGTKTKGTKIYS